jgi:cytochrome c oxidase assembly factor CtaG
MVEHSLLAGVVAPLLVLAWGALSRLRRARGGEAATSPRPIAAGLGHPLLAWSAFVAAQWVFHLTPLLEASEGNPLLHSAEHLAFLAVGVWFWMPVLGARGRRLGEPERALYLFLAAPAVDLVGVALMVRGDGGAGVAMLAGTLPIVVAAGIATWQWLAGEERRASGLEGAHGAL